jgi:Family of unknown function (DUF6289)
LSARLKQENQKMKIARSIGTVLIAAMAVAAAGPSLALPSEYVWITYYSDATYSMEVGEKHYLCSGRVVRLGEQTSYYTTYTAPC